MTFICNVTGQFGAKVTWDRLQGSLLDSRSVIDAAALTILNVSKNDSGSYVCTATSIMGSNSSTARLEVYSGLKFISRLPSSVLLYNGQTRKLFCSISSDLAVNVSWMFNGTSSFPQDVIFDSFDTLIVLSANFSHEGNYSCNAIDKVSCLQGNVVVRVKYPETCTKVRANISDVSGNYVIDPDGELGEDPFSVYCNMTDKGGVGVAVVSHDSEKKTHVKGFELPGHYTRNVHYIGTSLSQLAALTQASEKCEQFIKVECHGATINDAYWLSREREKMKYWGGVPHGKRCACGLTNSCDAPERHCNCAKNDFVWRKDSGLLTNRSHLPVIQLSFGDTGDSYEEVYYTLGKLLCYTSAGMTPK